MAKAWTGKWRANRCPVIESLTLSENEGIKVGATLTAELKAADPEGKPLEVKWVLMEDAERHLTAGYFQESPPSFKDHILKASNKKVSFRVPEKAGLYRIFAYVGDGDDGADVANVVFRAE